IPSSVMFNGVNIDITSIGDFAFNACNRLTSITIPNSMTSIGEEAFYNCDGLTSLIIPNSVTSIGEGAFESCSILRSINIPNSITSISENTFRLCRSLTSITIPSSVTSIGNMAFYGCSGLTSITIPNSVISIGQEAFSHCSGLTSITIPNSITSINSDVFESCTGLTSINIPNSVTSIGESAFENCTALTSITIPNSVTSIGDYAFGDCIGLTSINLSNSLTSIGVYAFGGCSGLTSLTIPSSVTSIDEAAFYDCSGLTSITINAINPPATNNYTFEDFNFSIPVYVPCNSLSSYQSDPNWNSFTNMIGIKNIIFVDTTICSGDSINYYGTNIDSAGVYYIVNGCDSIILTLNTNPSYNDTIFAEICQGSSYTLNGFNRNLSGFYTQNLQTSMGCDSIVNLSLTVNPALRDTIFAEICQGHTYNQFGFNESAAGFYTQNLQTENGCDSIVNLSLTVNPVYRDTIFAQICRGEVYNQFGFNEDSEGFYTQNLQSIKGCDSIVNLSLKYNSYYNGTMFVELCEGESYNAFGFNEDETGFYTQHLYTIAGCDSIMNLILVIQPKYNDTIFAEICEGDVYNQFGFNASTAGIYTQNLQSYFGCDSIVNLVLSVNQPTITNLTAEICQGETYTLNGFNVSTAGLHTQTLQTYKGCDSIVNLTLTVNQPTTTNLTAEICQGETYTLNGFNVSSAGLHTINLHSYKGCDSIVNLTLTVNQPAITNLSAEICQGKTYTLNGFNVSTTGLHTLNLQTYKGCDSTVNLTLTINQPAVTNISAEICQGETYTDNGFNVSTAGLHTLNLQTYKGCDSIINLTLTINQPATTNLTAEICQGETYTLNGFNVSTAGLHTQTLQTIKGCDSIVNLTLTINQPAITNLTAEICQGQAYNQNGFNVSTAGLHTQTLQTYKGCDSIVNLTLTVNQPAITNLTAEICQG
ncbi:MAG TPA: hypothetical protein DD434_07645, partial [Bacteroidales bacterium]|nr:hypothetical protein [Bacteroidales bacterium]